MFCYQCQETLKNEGCTKQGMCGKTDETANLMDELIHGLKSLAVVAEVAGKSDDKRCGRLIIKSLFTTITNANFDAGRIRHELKEALKLRDEMAAGLSDLPPVARVKLAELGTLRTSGAIGVMGTEDEDLRSLTELLTYGIKGIAAYAEHAAVLGYEDPAIYAFTVKALAATTRNLPLGDLLNLVLECGQVAVTTMALLDKANTETYGTPEISKVNIGVRKNPAILISGHDLKDMQQLLDQTAGTGVDVYTHGEMLPANYYPAFKKYSNLVGNYGGSWWHQAEEFEKFGGPILMTTNCIIPVKEAYAGRIFTTGQAGYPGVKHIEEVDGRKDFSELIALAKTCQPPVELESGEIVGGFAHAQVLSLADKIIEAVKAGAIKRFVVMAGCDGRHKSRSYFTEVAEALPEGTVILTAGCAKYRYNKLNLGDIGGIPRVLDAGQCNDCYSLAVIALKLKEAFGLDDINQLPLSFDIGWYEQKAVAVLLALLSLNVKGIRLGPTLPAFLSPGVVKVLVENFDIKPTTDVASDVTAIMAGN